jgi:hypothetical protein
MELNNKIKETELSKQKALIEMENKNKIFRQKLIGDALSSNKFNKFNLIDIIDDSLKDLFDHEK